MKPLPPLLCVLALTACSGKPPEPQAKPAQQVATPFDQMKQAEQRAKDVQKTVDQQAEEQRKQIEAQSQ
jgi:predicted small lipoprotein YifL